MVTMDVTIKLRRIGSPVTAELSEHFGQDSINLTSPPAGIVYI